jgi:histidyl-tRNA synthetase
MSKIEPTGPRPRLPRGLSDARAQDVRLREAMLATIREVYELYGFDALETPALEYTECLGKFLPDVERPEGGVFSLRDDDEEWLSLRYDLTAPLARFVAENFDALPKPFRRYQLGPVWRNEKPGPGRFRQFYQFDVDTVGTPTMAADAELAMVLCDVFDALGFARTAYRVRINNRKVLNGVLERIGVLKPESDDAEMAARRGVVLRAIDKLDRLGPAGVRQLLGAGRKDESGDFTAGAGLGAEQIATVLGFVEAGGGTRAEVGARLAKLVQGSKAGEEGVAELSQIASLLDVAGYDEARVIFDPSVVRGLAYYTGPVIEAEILGEITNEAGERVQVGSVAGGGRYDDLIMRFRGERVPATGVSIGVSRLVTALRALRREGAAAQAGPVVVLVLDGAAARAQAMVAELRRAKIRAELYLGGGGMRAQLKYADKRQSPIAVIEGEDERAKGEVVLKDLILGAEMAKAIADNKAWREDQPAQTSIKRADLVAAVRAMVERQRARPSV